MLTLRVFMFIKDVYVYWDVKFTKKILPDIVEISNKMLQKGENRRKITEVFYIWLQKDLYFKEALFIN